jgi:nicotinate-nucleotide adenylyltransferase
LLGGSFNPAHAGHLHASRLALRRLDLDQVWWLVSPQNPLKTEAATAPLDLRLRDARRLVGHDRRILVSDLESGLGTRYTVDTLHALRRGLPGARLVWLMGADNLIQLPHWERWTEIMELVPVAVLTRPTYSLRALAGTVAQRYRQRRVRPSMARRLADLEPPAWTFVDGPMNPASATAIRALSGQL